MTAKARIQNALGELAAAIKDVAPTGNAPILLMDLATYIAVMRALNDGRRTRSGNSAPAMALINGVALTHDVDGDDQVRRATAS